MFNNDFSRYFIEYDKVAEKLATIAEQSAKMVQNYPPFNIKKVNENEYAIELALAGFNKKDIDIEIVDSKLIITGKAESSDSEYVWKGISTKAFTRQFTLADNTEVASAAFNDGLLVIKLEITTPEKNTRKVKVL